MRQNKINSTTGSEIVTASEFKTYARINYSDDDSMIAKMLVQARIWCENYISRDIVAKNRTYYLDETQGVFDLPFGPVASISSVTIDGVANTDYTTPGLDNETVDIDGAGDKVKVTYITAGLDDNLLQQAVLQLAATYYDNRHDYVVGKAVSEVPSSVKDVLNSYKNMFI
tara:strand:- start:377 stop:886 length:510 start_codon:yes stop_codon:yes gene_type:complete